MRWGLVILTYVGEASPSGTRRRLPAALQSLRQSGYQGPLFIVDDGSTEAEHVLELERLSRVLPVIRRSSNGGISRAKNTCLRVLAEADVELGFIAEDDIEFSTGWFEQYRLAHEATGIHHFSWAWDDDPSGQMRKDTRSVRGYDIMETSLVNGVLLSFTRDILETVGGFKIFPAIWGHEHTHWTERIIRTGLAPFYADVLESNRYICLNAFASHSSVPQDCRLRFAEENSGPAGDFTKIYEPLIE